MGRLIDADVLELFIKTHSCSVGTDGVLLTVGEDKTWHNLLEYIPTVRDVDKVVEELKTDSSVKLYGSRNSDNYMIPVNRAIEIVKKGGVSDDVCEWKTDSHLENDAPAEWLICPHSPKKIFSTDIKYCPYCGKKIKVVE